MAKIRILEMKETTQYLEILRKRFGLEPEIFEPFQWVNYNTEHIHLVPKDFELPPAGFAWRTFGLPFLKHKLKYPKLTTAAAQKFGPLASRNFLNISGAALEDFLARREAVVPAAQAPDVTDLGYVFVRDLRGASLGLGFYRPETGVLLSLYPKYLSALCRTGVEDGQESGPDDAP